VAPLSHPDPLDRLCGSGAPISRDQVLEIRATAVVQGNDKLVTRCDLMLAMLFGDHQPRQERGRAA
jgi:hypothetical protein